MTDSSAVPTADANHFPGGDLLPELVLSLSAARPWGEHFADLLSLERGWLSTSWNAEDSGYEIAPEVLVVAHRILDQCETRGWNPPRVYPTEEGGVQLEWGLTQWHSEIEIELWKVDDSRSSILVDLYDLYDVKNQLDTFHQFADAATLEQFVETVASRPV